MSPATQHAEDSSTSTGWLRLRRTCSTSEAQTCLTSPLPYPLPTRGPVSDFLAAAEQALLSISNEDASNLPAALECQAPFLLAQLTHLLQQRPSRKLQSAPSDRTRSNLWGLVLDILKDLGLALEHQATEEPELVVQFLDQLNQARGANGGAKNMFAISLRLFGCLLRTWLLCL